MQLLSDPQKPEKRFDQDEQLSIVAFSHLLIGIGVVAIGRTFSIGDGVPTSFVIVEGGIFAVCLSMAVRYEGVRGLVNFWRPLWEPIVSLLPERIKGRGGYAEWAKGTVLYLAFLVQFANLVPLLEATGGPVESPFAPMVLAFAIFTPFLANEDYTMVLVLAFSILFYAGVMKFMETNTGLELGPNDKWAYLSVNTMMASMNLVITFVERKNQSSEGQTVT